MNLISLQINKTWVVHVHHSPEALICYKTSFFLLSRQPHKLLCPFNVKHGFLTKDAILIFQAYGIGSDCADPEGSNLRWRK